METPPPIDGDEVSLEDGKPHATQHTEMQKAQETQQKPMMTAATAATALRETSVVLSLPREHSMFLNCIPLSKNELGQDVLAKIHSVVWNTLFKSTKFYPQPSHANSVVGLCLYDCDFCTLGIQGDLARSKWWDAVRNEIILQTGIIRQQVVMQWHAVARGTYAKIVDCLKHNLTQFSCFLIHTEWLQVNNNLPLADELFSAYTSLYEQAEVRDETKKVL